MAGIGFALRGVFEKGPHFGPMRAFALATPLSAGPWLATCLAIAGLDALTLLGSHATAERLFLSLVTNAMAYSLVLMAPWQLVGTRLLAERLSEGRGDAVAADFWRLLPATSLLQLLLSAGFLAFVPLGLPLRVAALLLFQVSGGIWLALAYVLAMRDYRALAWAFAPGLALGLLGVTLGSRWGLTGQFAGVTSGEVVVFGVLLHAIARAFGAAGNGEGLVAGIWRHRWLALAGTFYAMGLWGDKWLFWHHAATGLALAGPVSASPVYDAAILLGALTALPGAALFLLKAEPNFNLQYRAYFRTITGQRGWSAIDQAKARMLQALREGLRLVLMVQGTLTLLIVIFAPEICQALGIHWFSLPVFRTGILAAGLQLAVGIAFTLLLYFDWQRTAAFLATGFAIANAGGTWLSIHVGLGAYGYGCLVASAITAGLAFGLLEHGLEELEFRVFMRPFFASRADTGAARGDLGQTWEVGG